MEDYFNAKLNKDAREGKNIPRIKDGKRTEILKCESFVGMDGKSRFLFYDIFYDIHVIYDDENFSTFQNTVGGERDSKQKFEKLKEENGVDGTKKAEWKIPCFKQYDKV
jgi:hypothetical protein